MASLTPPWLNEFFIGTLGLTKLPEYFPAVLASAGFFWFISAVVSRHLSLLVCPQQYKAVSVSRKNKFAWDCHVTSQAHALVIVVMAYMSMQADIDPAFGWDNIGGYTNAIACGYFLWDTLDAIVHFTDITFVLHGMACLSIYAMSFRPFILHFGSRFLMWELSTIPLNIRWFLLKIIAHSDKPSQRLKLFETISSAMLLFTFFCARIVWGSMLSLHFWQVFLEVRHEIPWPYYSIAAGNILLNGLNWLWFSKMMATLFRVISRQNKIANGTSVKN